MPLAYGVVECCSAVPACLVVFSFKGLCLSCSSDCSALLQLSLSEVLGFCSLFYLVHSHDALWDSLSRLMPSGIACLASQAPDWAVAFWNGLSGLLLVDL